MLSEYGASLETTQSVQLLAQVHTVKTNMLRSFRALVEQIESIVANVGALDADGNAAYMVMQDFKEQIEDLIEAADGYERCWGRKCAACAMRWMRRTCSSAGKMARWMGCKSRFDRSSEACRPPSRAARPRKSGQARLRGLNEARWWQA